MRIRDARRLAARLREHGLPATVVSIEEDGKLAQEATRWVVWRDGPWTCHADRQTLRGPLTVVVERDDGTVLAFEARTAKDALAAVRVLAVLES